MRRHCEGMEVGWVFNGLPRERVGRWMGRMVHVGRSGVGARSGFGAAGEAGVRIGGAVWT